MFYSKDMLRNSGSWRQKFVNFIAINCYLYVLHIFYSQETSNKELSLLAKSAFELLKWRILHRPFLETAISSILSSVNDPNWRTRSALLSYLRTFTYRSDYFVATIPIFMIVFWLYHEYFFPCVCLV